MKYVFKSQEELREFISENIIITVEVAGILDCSRQYIDELVKRKKIVPIKQILNDKWFLKSDVDEFNAGRIRKKSG